MDINRVTNSGGSTTKNHVMYIKLVDFFMSREITK